MRARTRHAIAHAVLIGGALVAAGPFPAVAGPPTAHAAAHPLQVLVRRVTTLDAHGHIAHMAISAQPLEKVKVRVGYGYAPHSGSLQVCKKPTPLRANCTMILATVCAHLSGTICPG